VLDTCEKLENILSFPIADFITWLQLLFALCRHWYACSFCRYAVLLIMMQIDNT